MRSPLPGSRKMGRQSFYIPAESVVVSEEEMAFYPDPHLLRMPRKGPGFWHELDYVDTLILDKTGVPIAYLEILKPRDDRIPDAETIEVVEIFATLAGIAIENAQMFEAQVESRRNAEFYTDLLSHDIKNFNQAIIGYLDLLKSRLPKPEDTVLVDRIIEQEMSMSRLAHNVRTMSRVTFGDTKKARTDLGAALLECIENIGQYFPSKKISVSHSIRAGAYLTTADELLRELFVNILTNSVKYDPHETVEIDISVEKSFDDKRAYWRVAVADRGKGVPDELKESIFSRFSDAPRKKGSGLGLHIVSTLVRRYKGKVWVEDRVQGDHSQGAVFIVNLPAVE
jgi:signal transduction histidine kinase